eukprot:TRINITY_DN11247_c0_g2_i1.p1 TRINITY_DN11247_c0_g2~~TRINITY_DN11247_c0_g2_i1.p1  ORF type:complete len:185 (+),score=33.53 TRINITY_DN11247_c0_g2_i1:195-749(+)
MGNCCKSALAGNNTQDSVEVTLTSSQLGAGGSGVVLCSISLDQDRAYWEVSVEQDQGGCWFGVAGRIAKVEATPKPGTERGTQDQEQLWGVHSQDLEGAAFEHLKIGDVVGVLYDQACGPPTLEFFLNGKHVDAVRISHIRGQVTPGFGVEAGSGISCNMTHKFKHPPTGQFSSDGIMAAGQMM